MTTKLNIVAGEQNGVGTITSKYVVIQALHSNSMVKLGKELKTLNDPSILLRSTTSTN